MPDLITITSGVLTARINPFGAELWSLTDGDHREWMTDADPAFWTGHAPLLFPIVGGLVGDRYRLGDKTYDLPRHGFARRNPFELVEAGTDHARFRLTDTEATRAAYPFAFTLDMAFRLEGSTLRMAATVTNPGAEVLPFSFGYHPAFAWPLPGGGAKTAHVVRFAEPEQATPLRRLDAAGLLLPDPEPSPVVGDMLPLDPGLFAADALIWTDLASRSLRYGVPGGPALEIAFPDTAMLGLWQKPGANFLCIEPWAGHADPQGFAGDFTEKPGVLRLPPGESHTIRMDVTVIPG